MPVKILIVDPVATNRIVLKVKLMSAFYEVLQAASLSEAQALVDRAAPDVVMLGSGLAADSVAVFVAQLTSPEDTMRSSVIALLPEQNDAARSKLLAAGVDEVMERPLDDQLLLARLRCLMRADQAERELRLRDGTRRALGLAEAAAGFDAPPRIAMLGNDPVKATRIATSLKRAMPGAAIQSDIRASLLSGDDRNPPDVFVVVLTDAASDDALGLISNIRARSHLRDVSILAIAPGDARQLTMMALDQGANDLVPDTVSGAELTLRVKRLAARKRTNERLRKTVQTGLHAALTDPLTGLYNRRYAIPHLQRMAERCRLSGRSFAVMIADLDHFKRVNDRYGHAAGDAVLVETAERLTCNLRAVDLIARIGGEEFLVAMPDTNQAAAQAAAKRLCDVIGNRAFTAPGTTDPIRLTASIGVVLSNGEGTEQPGAVDALMVAADKALYGSKLQGRNQVTLARSAA